MEVIPGSERFPFDTGTNAQRARNAASSSSVQYAPHFSLSPGFLGSDTTGSSRSAAGRGLQSYRHFNHGSNGLATKACAALLTTDCISFLPDSIIIRLCACAIGTCGMSRRSLGQVFVQCDVYRA